MDVGFIGIGSMGAAMVPNLVKAGHRVSVWNRTLAAAKAIESVTVLTSPAAAFENDAAVTMLSDDTAVRSSEGIAYVAALVFGVPAVAAKAQLDIMVAGNAEAVATVQPLLDAMGQKTWHLGDDPKHATVAKIAGNMMITLAIEAMGEATALTESYGLKAVDFLEVVTNTMFTSPSYKRYGGNIANNSYEPGFKLTLGLKDVNLALEAAKAKHALLHATEIVRENMLKAVDQGLGSKDWSALAKVTRRRAGLEEGEA